ncbi:MAG: N-6 DNA methylase [Solirubrobacterales bacterium]|nr:N-6 DNA methylase [Solirubrobacterales bacterium]
MPPVPTETRDASGPASFSAETREWLDRAALSDRKSLGQYMTPRVVREALIDRLDLFDGMRVLDPGVGTGEFLRAIREREPPVTPSRSTSGGPNR